MDKNNIKDWIERLQQESWNLELLVSGFSILLLIQAKNQLANLSDHINLHFAFSDEIFSMVYTSLGAVTLGCIALVVCLTVHILLRGFWIGTIGLRSVQPKVDFKKLRYAPAFEKRLQERLPSLDQSLIRLDQVSSAIFSFAFLIIFMLLSLVAWFVVMSSFILVRNYIDDLFATETWFSQTIFLFFTAMAVLILCFGILYLIDTLSGGILKKVSWFKSRPYIWIYQVMTVITLSFMYRSIYYHLISYFGVWPARCRHMVHVETYLNVDFSSLAQAKIQFRTFFYKENQIFWFPWCSIREDLSIDVSIANVGLILTKPG